MNMDKTKLGARNHDSPGPVAFFATALFDAAFAGAFAAPVAGFLTAAGFGLGGIAVIML